MTHLIIGASGLVGEHLLRALEARGVEAVGTYHERPVPGLRRLDVRDAGAVERLVAEVRPAVVHLPAARPDVEACERSPEPAWEVNVGGVVNVAAALRRWGGRLAYLSSDYVFDGRSGPYREEEPPRPISEYGRQKVVAEHHTALHVPGSLIVRTTVVYGWEGRGKNFVLRLVETLSAGGRVRAPADQVGSPTFAPNLAEVVVELAGAGASGVWNVVGPDLMDRAAFAREAALAFGLDPGRIDAVTTAELGQVAPRPLRGGLRVDRVRGAVDVPLVGVGDGLREMAAARQGAVQKPRARRMPSENQAIRGPRPCR